MNLDGFGSIIQSHRSWLNGFDAQHARNWENLLKADDEAAVCEAIVCQVLQEADIQVEPNADLAGATRQPDFRCQKDSSDFYVEATCVHQATLTGKTGLSSSARGCGSTYWQGFLEAVFSECQSKTPQCADMSAPCVVAIGTFHGFGAMAFIKNRSIVERLLTGETKMAWRVNPKTGETSETITVTGLWPAVFVKPDEDAVAKARCPISAILVCGFTLESKPIYGLLHPKPEHAFDRTLLPNIEFCRLKDGYQQGILQTEWI